MKDTTKICKLLSDTMDTAKVVVTRGLSVPSPHTRPPPHCPCGVGTSGAGLGPPTQPAPAVRMALLLAGLAKE